MRNDLLLSSLLCLSSCTFGTRLLGETGGETSEGDETGEGETGAPEAGEPCWTEERTALGYLHDISVDAEHMIVSSDDGLWIEDQGLVSLDPSLAAELQSMSSAQILGDPDDLWIAHTQLWHWDGLTLTEFDDGISENLLREMPSGELWRMGEAWPEGEPELVLQRWSGQSWDDQPTPALEGVTHFEVGPGVLWLLQADGLGPHELASRVGEGEWSIEEVPLGPLGFGDAKVAAGASGGLFVAAPGLTCTDTIELVYRDLGGMWHTRALILDAPLDTCALSLYVVGDIAYLHPAGTSRLWRWDGLSEPTDHGAWPGLELATDGTRLVGVANSPGPSFYELSVEPSLEIEVLDERLSFSGGPSSGVSLDAMFTGSPDMLQRWDGEGWTGLVEIADLGEDVAGLRELWAASPSLAFALTTTAGSADQHLWRWQDGELTSWDTPGFAVTGLWGHEGEVWAAGRTDDNTGAIWRYEGQDWSVALELDDHPVGLSGDGERLYLVDDRAQVWAWAWAEPGEPLALGEPLDERADTARLAVLGPDALLVVDSVWSDQFLPGEDHRRFVVWDGAQWTEMSERWPEGPSGAAQLVEDRRGGVFALDTYDGAEALWYGDGETWELIPTPDGVVRGVAGAAPEGLVLIEGRYTGQRTREFRWSCPQ